MPPATVTSLPRRPAAVPDHVRSLRDSFALHLDNTLQPAMRRIHLAALDGLIEYLEANDLPVGVGLIKREHIEGYLGKRRTEVKPTSVSIELRVLAKFWAWALDEDEVEVSPMAKMKGPKIPDEPVPVISAEDFKMLLATASGRDFTSRRDAAVLLFLTTPAPGGPRFSR